MSMAAHQCDGGLIEVNGVEYACPHCLHPENDSPRLRVAHARTTDPRTSHEAAASVQVSVSESFVLACLRDIGEAISDERLVAYIRETYPDQKIADSRIRTARGKLAEMSPPLVRWAGRGRTTRDKACNLWEANPV